MNGKVPCATGWPPTTSASTSPRRDCARNASARASRAAGTPELRRPRSRARSAAVTAGTSAAPASASRKSTVSARTNARQRPQPSSRAITTPPRRDIGLQRPDPNHTKTPPAGCADHPMATRGRPARSCAPARPPRPNCPPDPGGDLKALSPVCPGPVLNLVRLAAWSTNPASRTRPTSQIGRRGSRKRQTRRPRLPGRASSPRDPALAPRRRCRHASGRIDRSRTEGHDATVTGGRRAHWRRRLGRTSPVSTGYHTCHGAPRCGGHFAAAPPAVRGHASSALRETMRNAEAVGITGRTGGWRGALSGVSDRRLGEDWGAVRHRALHRVRSPARAGSSRRRAAQSGSR